jgi:hypothetical protein
MRWYVWLLLSPVILAVVGAIAVWVAYKLSPEGREDAAIKRRMEGNARKAEQEIYERHRERVREELRREEQRDDGAV